MIPGVGNRGISYGSMIREIVSIPGGTWLRALVYAVIASVVIAVPTDLIDTPVFGRPVESGWVDYAILAMTASLIGLIMAIRPPKRDSAGLARARERDDRRTLWGGFVSFLAVGCPMCNKLVVALVGVSGAMSWWAPIQPVVGLGAVALLLYTLRKRLIPGGCPVT